MKKARKIISLALVFAMLVTAFVTSVPVNAEVVTGECGDNLTWSLNTDKFVITISGTGDMGDYTYKGSPWASRVARYRCVVVEEGVTSIGNNAFPYLYASGEGINGVELNEGLLRIGDSAFSNCPDLGRLFIPDSVKSIGSSAFANCPLLLSLEIPSGIETIGNNAFANCMLKDVVLPQTLTSLGSNAFTGCSKMSNVVFLNRDTVIGSGAVPSNAAIWGYDDSTAEQYANSNGRTFYSIDDYQSHNVTLNANGGTFSNNSPTLQITRYHNQFDMDISSYIPTRKGYRFVGWAKDQSTYTPDYKASYPTNSVNDVSLYAVWREEFVLEPLVQFEGKPTGEDYDSVKIGVENGNSSTFVFESAKWTNSDKTTAELRTDFSYGIRNQADVILVLDVSSSMLMGEKYEEMVKKVKEVVNTLLGTEGYNNRVAIVTFGGQLDDSLDFTSDLATAQNFVNNLPVDFIGTNYDAGLNQAYNFLVNRDDVSRDSTLVFFTDGISTMSNGKTPASKIKNAGCEISTIAYGASGAMSNITAISSSGAAYDATNAQEFNDYMNLALSSSYGVYDLTSVINTTNFSVTSSSAITLENEAGEVITGAVSLAADGKTLVLDTKKLNPNENYTIVTPLQLKQISGQYPTGTFDVLSGDAIVELSTSSREVNRVASPVLTRTTGDETYTLNYYDGTQLLQSESIEQGNGKYTIIFAPLTNPESGANVKDGIPQKSDHIFSGWYITAQDAVNNTLSQAYLKTFTLAEFADDNGNVNLYAGWVDEGTPAQDASDTNDYGKTTLDGYALEGVQIRKANVKDPYTNEYNKAYDGLRFLTVYGNAMLTELDRVSSSAVEYGYAVALRENLGQIKTGFTIDSYSAKDVDCTREGDRNHHYYDDYRLSTLVIKYETEAEQKDYLSKQVIARPYVEYTDANGFHRYAYDDYKGPSCSGDGCSVSMSEAIAGIEAYIQSK